MSLCNPKSKILVAMALAILVSGCEWFKSQITVDELGERLQAILDDVVEGDEAIPSAALHVEIPRIGFSWEGAAGFADPEHKTNLTPQNPIRIASNTKTFVAVAVLRLYEQGQINLDGPIEKYLSADSVQILRNGGYDPEAITVRHLLTHTSGLYDYTASNEFAEQYEADVNHRWTRKEQLQGAMDWGDTYGAPGKVFHYSDTGYILLGEILEQVTGKSFASALRTLIGYEKIGLTSTWLETLEARPSSIPDRAHQYEGDFDTYSIDPSIDLYGGGGLVSTMGDLAKFTQATFTGRVFAKPGTLETMLSTIPAINEEPAPPKPTNGTYCMGIEVAEVEGMAVYINYGYWGTMAAYVPSLDLSFGATINQNEDNSKSRKSILHGTLKLAGKTIIQGN